MLLKWKLLIASHDFDNIVSIKQGVLKTQSRCDFAILNDPNRSWKLVSPSVHTYRQLSGSSLSDLLACYVVAGGGWGHNPALSCVQTLPSVKTVHSPFLSFWQKKGKQRTLVLFQTQKKGGVQNKKYMRDSNLKNINMFFMRENERSKTFSMLTKCLFAFNFF